MIRGRRYSQLEMNSHFTSIWSLSLWLFAALYITVDAQGQTLSGDTPTLRSMMSEQQVKEQSVQERLNALIKSTQQARRERQEDESEASSEGTKALDANVVGAAGQWNGSQDDYDTTQGSHSSSQSMSEIRERIRILQRLRRDRRMSLDASSANSLPGGVESPSLRTPGGSVIPTESTSPPAEAENPKSPPISPIDASLVAQETTEVAEPIDSTDQTVAAERILPNPVNAIALGESLYRTRNYESALNAFRSVDPATLSQSDRTWRDLLVALCQRKLGEYEAAQGTLREIANEESVDYPVMAAKWWLKHVEGSHSALTKLNEVSSDFDALLERSSKYVTP